jgi:transducin (beta)-like 1
MSVTSDEVNYLVYRYLLENGFNHSSFALRNETDIHRSEIKGTIRPGFLVQLLQKGLLYLQVEQHLLRDGSEVPCSAPFTLLGKHECRLNLKEEQEALTRLRERSQELSFKIFFGHEGEVFVCSWHPSLLVLATGSGDGCVRIWSVPSQMQDSETCIVLQHSTLEKKDVTTLEWSPNGQFLASGSYDGCLKIWTRLGDLVYTLHQHQGPLFCLKWNPKGDLVITGSVDKTCIVWDALTGEPRQTFSFHSGFFAD